MKTVAQMLFLLLFAGLYYSCSSTSAMNAKKGVTATPSSSSGALYDTLSNSQNTRLVDRSGVEEQNRRDSLDKIKNTRLGDRSGVEEQNRQDTLNKSRTRRDTMNNKNMPRTANSSDWSERSTTRPLNMNDTSGMGSEGEALALLAAANTNEINAAAEAQKKQISSPVMKYARMLQDHHEDNLAKTRQLGQTMNLTLNETKDVATLTKKGSSDWLLLADLQGEEFEMAYLDAMIKGHREVLDLIDSKLMKAAKSDAFRNHLMETRKTLAMHLEEAKKLKEER